MKGVSAQLLTQIEGKAGNSQIFKYRLSNRLIEYTYKDAVRDGQKQLPPWLEAGEE